jgi:hypothetical protein
VASGTFTVESDGVVEEYDSYGRFIPIYTPLSYTQLKIKAEGITYLEFQDSNFEYIECVGLSDLEQLIINNCQITSCKIGGLPNLYNLDICDNQLTSLDIKGLPGLTSLFLANNELNSVNLTAPSNLIYLSLENNNLTTFNCTGLDSLEYLNLSGNSNLSEVIIPNNYNSLGTLILSSTALGDMTSPDSAWDSIINSLPAKGSTWRGALYVSDTALKDLLQASLSGKYWSVYVY